MKRQAAMKKRQAAATKKIMAITSESPVVFDGPLSIARNIYAHLVGTERGCSLNDVHGFRSLMQFLCTHKKASRMVGLNCPEALCTPEEKASSHEGGQQP